MKGNHVKILIIHINAGRIDFCKIKVLLSDIGNLHASGYDIHVIKCCVQKLCLQTCVPVNTYKLQCHAVLILRKGRWKSFKLWFSIKNFMRHIREHGARVACCRFDAKAAFPVIAHAACWVFKREAVIEGASLPVID